MLKSDGAMMAGVTLLNDMEGGIRELDSGCIIPQQVRDL